MLQLNFLYFLSFKEIYFFGNLTGFKIILFFVGKYTEYYGMLQQTTLGLAKLFCPLQEKNTCHKFINLFYILSLSENHGKQFHKAILHFNAFNI